MGLLTLGWACYEEFTVGQERSMYTAWRVMRAPHLYD